MESGGRLPLSYTKKKIVKRVNNLLLVAHSLKYLKKRRHQFFYRDMDIRYCMFSPIF
jgi:hypothetical protein